MDNQNQDPLGPAAGSNSVPVANEESGGELPQ
ncbi:MAG: hypothetical protein UU67_C0071G0015 [Candidatus Daviesbacteria bacterium GW2011_GWB1_41_5]|uniref:Uncharacterized protein n=1 Tax=Candidatus Daviesbacteria bacterium GW2011_GWB1_41_5 TaxID=1618429 RepID=A0A0G0WEU1_9BACT|nr:MAG: hypothetical protein UU67_C0071G0015 [Candidatus Daviesbacteria bacterium GW2011_GWB1_41_5]